MYDVIVIGGGPAGSCAALSLARAGRSVLVVEKATSPRFHIGESLIPYLMKIFEKLGVLDKIKESSFVLKLGIDVSLENGEFVRPPFGFLAEGQHRYAYNVERARMDDLLLRAAGAAGAEILVETPVKELLFDGERMNGVAYEQDGKRVEARAKFVIDASGRAGLVAKHFGLRKMNTRLENIALFQHYDNCDPANVLSQPGDFMLSCHLGGWVWSIPLAPHKTSIGVVVPAKSLKGKTTQEVFDHHLGRSPRVAHGIKGATPIYQELKVESDYCYHTEQMVGPGYFIVGDAGCFVDPLFSGGMFLAATTGMKAAETICEILDGRPEAEAQSWFQNLSKTGYDSYFRLILCFYGACEWDVARIFRFFPGGFHFAQQTLCGDFWGLPDQPVLKTLRADPSLAVFEQPFERIYECPIYPGVGYSSTNLPPPDPF